LLIIWFLLSLWNSHHISMYRNVVYFFLSVLLLLVSCGKEEIKEFPEMYKLDLPWGFPQPIIPEDNPLTKDRVKLGEMLFFDPILSRDSTVSCASCHLPEKKFTDALPKSIGIHGRLSMRNSPTLINTAYRTSFFKDGGVPTLELQALAPISDSAEMDFSVPEVIERLKKIEKYVTLSKKAFGREPDPFVLTRSLAAFQRTLIGGNSRYDQYLQSGDEQILSKMEKKGMLIFFGEANCGFCHTGFLLTDQKFHNNGLYDVYADNGRMRITLNPDDEGRFVTPSLRNVSLTAPYMHDGSLATLEEVVNHYNSGGSGHVNQDSRIRPLNLSEEDKSALVKFLLVLDDGV
jgi:cytochrome c peroxidase